MELYQNEILVLVTFDWSSCLRSAAVLLWKLTKKPNSKVSNRFDDFVSHAIFFTCAVG